MIKPEEKITEHKPIVHCNMCDWEGQEEDLKELFEEGGNYETRFFGCPNCKTDDYLMDR